MDIHTRLFYTVTETQVIVVSCFHTARDPNCLG